MSVVTVLAVWTLSCYQHLPSVWSVPIGGVGGMV